MLRQFASRLGLLVLVFAGGVVLPVAPQPAAAQGFRESTWWDEDPRTYRQPRRAPRYEDPYYQPPAGERWRYEPGRGWTRRSTREAWDGFEQPRSRPRRPATAEDDWGDDGVEDRDTGQGKAAGVGGGPRPLITPRRPPVVAFAAGTKYKAGEIVIDTSARRLYYVRNSMSAFAYPIGVGRDGFSWTGQQKVSRIADWPDWYPPAEMRKRKPELPERMLGGLNNPLGAKAIYLGNTLYRIHGTNEPKSIGRAESSGCFRMMNEHVLHLASLVQVGTQVTVLRSLRPGSPARTATAKPRTSQPRMLWSADPDSSYTYPDDYGYR